MAEQISITKFNINENVYYVKIFWKPNQNDLFHIKIFDGDISWSGHYSYEFASKIRERLEETEDYYYEKVKNCLSCHQQDFKYAFTVEPNNNSATFSFKKRFEDPVHGVGYLLIGSVPIHRDEINESKDILLDFLLEENTVLRNTINSLKAKNEEINGDLNKCKEDLVKFVDIKSNLENSLYGKFVQLLNAKKRRIQLLEDTIHAIEKPVKSSDEDELD